MRGHSMWGTRRSEGMCRSFQHHFPEEEPFHYVYSEVPMIVEVLIEGRVVSMELDVGSAISTASRGKFQRMLPSQEVLENDIRIRTSTTFP